MIASSCEMAVLASHDSAVLRLESFRDSVDRRRLVIIALQWEDATSSPRLETASMPTHDSPHPNPIAPPNTDPLHGFVEMQMPSDLRYEIETAIDGNAMSFGHTYIRTHDGGNDVLVEANWRESSGSSSSHSTPRSNLLLYFYRPDAHFPEFDIIPRDGLGVRILSFAAGALGLPTLDLPNEPEFMKRYMIVTANPGSVRSLLDRAAIDALIEARDLHIKSTDVGIIAMRSIKRSRSWRKIDDASQRNEFERMVIDATLACMAIVDDPEAGRRAESAVPGSFTEEAARTMLHSGGIMSAKVRKRLVPQRVVDALRDHPPPRWSTDPAIRRRAWGGTAAGMFGAGVFALGFGGIGIGLLSSSNRDFVELIVGSLFSMVGAGATLAILLVLRHRLIRQRIVRRGRVVPAHIDSIERTDTIINGERIHRVKFRLQGAQHADEEPIAVNIKASYVHQARRIHREQAPTWILQDPAKPRRALWPEGWVLEVE
ncbi:MAG: hypothetical protein EA380_01605 [Phycisphaeraceae bacterium]|nr:MAG: hypothetical protein EA380_01605 [Phycisphaeraceae bacterium]